MPSVEGGEGSGAGQYNLGEFGILEGEAIDSPERDWIGFVRSTAHRLCFGAGHQRRSGHLLADYSQARVLQIGGEFDLKFDSVARICPWYIMM